MRIAAASHLNVTIDTAKWHIREHCRKAGYVTVYQLVAWAIAEGYLDKTVLDCETVQIGSRSQPGVWRPLTLVYPNWATETSPPSSTAGAIPPESTGTGRGL